MHDQLARIYHLARRILFSPLWRAPVAAFAAGLVVRFMAPARAAVGAALAVLIGWLALVLPLNPFTAAGPVARLPGAAVLLALFVHHGRDRWPALVLYATASAWWLRGAPLSGQGIVYLVPVILGILAAAAIARRIAATDQGGTTILAALALAVALQLAGAAPHWSRAALAPAAAGVALLGLPGAVPALVQAIVLVAIAAIVANDRGRVAQVDLAAATPVIIWWLGTQEGSSSFLKKRTKKLLSIK